MTSLIALDFVFTDFFEGPLSKYAGEKNNGYLFDVSYNLLLVLFCLITLFESVFYTNNPREIAKSINSFFFSHILKNVKSTNLYRSYNPCLRDYFWPHNKDL